MQTFYFAQAEDANQAATLLADADGRGAKPIAGGTTLLDLMKLNIMHPGRLVDINKALSNRIEVFDGGVRLGAMVRMAEAAAHETIVRDYPVVAQSLLLAASSQIRNMASLGGNVLQRTRCGYFRDPTVVNCNKRKSGSGCAAFDGINRMHAVLGTSRTCIATYHGDFAQALILLDAKVDILGHRGKRTIAFGELHVRPDRDPAIETTLQSDDLITAFVIPAASWARRSLYLKIRDRDSYAYALASAAVALDLDGDRIRRARIALGGVATVPWRAIEAEKYLEGKILNDDSAAEAGRVAFSTSETRSHNAFKPKLGERTVARALMLAKGLEI